MISLKYLIPALLLLLSFVGYQVYSRGFYTLLNTSNLERVSVKQAQKILAQQSVTILDVRDENEYAVSHLKDAHRYEDGMLDSLDINVPVLVYCTVGVRSNKLAKTMLEKGFSEVYDLKDGIIGWSNTKLPVVNIRNERTDSIHVYNQYFGQLLKEGIPIY